MAHARIDANPLSLRQFVLRTMPPSELHRIAGGRCWDGPLGDRDECPPQPTNRGSFVVTSIEHFAADTLYET